MTISTNNITKIAIYRYERIDNGSNSEWCYSLSDTTHDNIRTECGAILVSYGETHLAGYFISRKNVKVAITPSGHVYLYHPKKVSEEIFYPADLIYGGIAEELGLGKFVPAKCDEAA